MRLRCSECSTRALVPLPTGWRAHVGREAWALCPRCRDRLGDGPTHDEITEETERQERYAALGWALCAALLLTAWLGWLAVTP